MPFEGDDVNAFSAFCGEIVTKEKHYFNPLFFPKKKKAKQESKLCAKNNKRVSV